MNGTEIVAQDAAFANATLKARQDYAVALANAGDLLPRGLRDNQNRPVPGKILLVAETGRMLGIDPIAAINGVNIIDGKPTILPGLMSGVVRRAGHKLRVTTKGTIEGGDFSATATLVRTDDPENPFTSTWTPHRAVRAGLCTYAQTDGVWAVRARSSNGRSLPWENYTEAMCKARAISEVCREGAEDVLMGARYTSEELGAVVDEEGNPVDSGTDSATASAGAIATPVATRDWATAIDAVETLEACAALYREADAAGELGLVVGMAGDKDDGSADTVMDLFWIRKAALERAVEVTTPTMVDVPVTKLGRRQWVREARALTERDAVHALLMEATAAGAPVQVLEELGAIERTLPAPEAPVEGWATAAIPGDGEWREESPGVFVEPGADEGVAGVLDETIGGES